MNNNECCKVEAAPRRCVADYEKTTRECLLEVKNILRSIYLTVSGSGGAEPAEVGTPNNMMENAQINEDLAMEIRGMAKEINMELFGCQ